MLVLVQRNKVYTQLYLPLSQRYKICLVKPWHVILWYWSIKLCWLCEFDGFVNFPWVVFVLRHSEATLFIFTDICLTLLTNKLCFRKLNKVYHENLISSWNFPICFPWKKPINQILWSLSLNIFQKLCLVNKNFMVQI